MGGGEVGVGGGGGGAQCLEKWLALCTMGWLQLVGSLKSWVSFAEYRLFYRALLQKRLIILRSLLIVGTPYRSV